MAKEWKVDDSDNESTVPDVETALRMCFYQPTSGGGGYMKQCGALILFWKKRGEVWEFCSRKTTWPQTDAVWSMVTLLEGPLPPVEIYRIEGAHVPDVVSSPGWQKTCLFHEPAVLEARLKELGLL
jgi:hypothetical protein